MFCGLELLFYGNSIRFMYRFHLIGILSLFPSEFFFIGQHNNNHQFFLLAILSNVRYTLIIGRLTVNYGFENHVRVIICQKWLKENIIRSINQ